MTRSVIKVENAALAESFFYDVLPGGLTLYILPKRGTRQKHALLAVNFGSIDQSFAGVPGDGQVQVPAGIAHFLEHRIFERGGRDITEVFTALGAEVNAHTSFTSTAYFFTCVDRLGPCLELLLDFVLDSELSSEGLEREREIISREIQLYQDSLECVSFFALMQSLYPAHPLGVDIAGTIESIRGIDYKVLQSCYSAFYHPANMSLFISGDVEVEGIQDQVHNFIEKLNPVKRSPNKRHISSVVPAVIREHQEVEMPIHQAHLCLGFKDQRGNLKGKDLLRRELASELALDILFGPSGSFYTRYYEKGLLDVESFGTEVYAEPEFSFCVIGGDAPQPEALEKALLARLCQAGKGDLVKRDFLRAKRKAYGHLIQQFDQVENCVAQMYSAVSRGAQPFDFLAAYEELSAGDISDCLETWLDPSNCAVALVKPVE